MIRIGYIGDYTTPEYIALSGRPKAVVAAVSGHEGSSEHPPDAVVFPSATALVDSADIDAVVIAANSEDQASLVQQSAKRGLPMLVVPPMTGTVSAATTAADAVIEAGVVSAVARPVRNAINLIQIRRTVMQYGATTITGRIVGDSVPYTDIERMLDTLRYVGGEIERIISVADPSPQLTVCALVYQSGAGGELSITRGWTGGVEFIIDVISAGTRFRYFHGSNHIEIDETEHMAADRIDGQYVATVAGFITAVELNTPSPIVSNYPDAVDTLRTMHQLADLSEAIPRGNG